MSRRINSVQAELFAALGDKTRLRLVSILSGGRPHSISELTAGSRITRQAVTKHLRILERAEIVRCSQVGRERIYSFNPSTVEDLKDYLDGVFRQWDEALARLKSFVEK